MVATAPEYAELRSIEDSGACVVTSRDDAGSSLDATLQHIEVLAARQRHLLETQTEAEEQLLHRAGTQYRSGALTFEQLFALYRRYRAVESYQRATRWNKHIDIPWNRIAAMARARPNGPEGTWIGSCPLGSFEPAPREGTPVVYVLFDATNEPIYVGSTDNLRARIKAHIRDGKGAAYWQAYRCEDREDAYTLEEKLHRERLPRLNRKIGR